MLSAAAVLNVLSGRAGGLYEQRQALHFTSLHFTHTAFLLLEADRFLASLPRLSRLTVLSQLDAFDENYIVVYHLGVCVCVCLLAVEHQSVSVQNMIAECVHWSFGVEYISC